MKIKYYEGNKIIEKEVRKVVKVKTLGGQIRYRVHETDKTGIGNYYFIEEKNIIELKK